VEPIRSPVVTGDFAIEEASMKLVLISTSLAVVLLAAAATYILPSMSNAAKSRDYAQSNFVFPVRN
jgi:hypothetical protein